MSELPNNIMYTVLRLRKNAQSSDYNARIPYCAIASVIRLIYLNTTVAIQSRKEGRDET